MSNDDDFDPWYSAEVGGWKAFVLGACMMWCLGSGVYTLALLVRLVTP